MEIVQVDILLRLLVAHLLADFVLQTDTMAEEKKKGLCSKYFFVHISIVGVLTYLLLAQWCNWWAPILVMVIHTLIDILKTQIKKDNVWTYLSDQLLHLISLIFIWVILSENSIASLWKTVTSISISEKLLLIITAYIIISIPISVLIGYMTQKWLEEIKPGKDESLTKAGKWIGILERILIFTFIIMKQWAVIGFLIAAKSVFRFGDLKEGKDRKKTEYILIGTLLSFASVIIIGIIIQFMLVNLK